MQRETGRQSRHASFHTLAHCVSRAFLIPPIPSCFSPVCPLFCLWSGVCSFFFGCCGSQTHNPKGTTLVTERSCTDKLILLLYIFAWVVSIVVVSTAAGLGGNPYKIINGINFKGEICGYDSAVKDRSQAALINPLSFDPTSMSAWTCVEDCAETSITTSPHFATMYGSTSCQYKTNK